MKKLTKLSETHFIIVDDSEIKEGDYVYDLKDKCIRYVKKYLKDNWIKKITHSTLPLEDVGLNTSMGNQLGFAYIEPLSLQECEELTQGYSIEKMAYDATKKQLIRIFSGESKEDIDDDIQKRRYYYELGFNAHKELVKDKLILSVEDMKVAIQSVMKNINDEVSNQEEIIQSLLPKTEWEIEIDENNKMKLI